MDNPPPLTRHARRRMQTRQRLIQATLQLVLDKGFDAISIQDITDKADLGRGTFYIHFKDKEEVVWTAFEEMYQQLEQKAHSQLDRRTPQVEYFGLLNIFRHVQENRVLYRVMFGGQGSAALTVRVQDFLANTFLTDIRAAPEPPEVNFNIPEEIEAQILTGVISRLIYWWLETPNRYTPEQMAAMTYEVLYRQLPPVDG